MNPRQLPFRFLFCLFPLLTCCAAGVHAQFTDAMVRYNDAYQKAIRAKHAHKTDSAIFYFRLAHQANPDMPAPYSYLGDLLQERGKYQEAISLYEESISRGFVPGDLPTIFLNYDSVQHRPDVKAFSKRYPSLISKYRQQHYDSKLALSKLVYQMLGRDQAIRGYDHKAYRNDSLTFSTTFAIQQYLDTAVNLPELLDYLKANGFPFPGEMSQDLQLIIHHLLQYDGTMRDELDRLVRKAVYAGKYPAYAYLLAMDYDHMHKTGKQLYGTYMGQRADNSYFFDPPIDDISTVNQRRAQWGLLKLHEISFTDWRNPEMPSGYKP